MVLRSRDEAVARHSGPRGSRYEEEGTDHPKEDRAGHLEQEAGSGIGHASSSRLSVVGSYDDSHLDGGCSHEQEGHHDVRRSIHHPREDSHRTHGEAESASVGPYNRHRHHHRHRQSEEPAPGAIYGENLIRD